MSFKDYKPKSKRIEQDKISIKILEPFSKDPIEFVDKDEFISYLQEHKEEMDKTTTHMLNKAYRIPGYTITKIKGEISLKAIKNNTTNNDILDRIEYLEEKLEAIVTILNKTNLTQQ